MTRFRVPVLALEGSPTDDGRTFAALRWRDLPLTLYAQLENAVGHDKAPIAGSIDEITRGDNGVLSAVIDTDDDGAVGQEAARLIERQDLRGISIDVAPQGSIDEECIETDDDGFCIAANVVFEEGVIGAATLVGFPAFWEANTIDPTPLDDHGTDDEGEDGTAEPAADDMPSSDEFTATTQPEPEVEVTSRRCAATAQTTGERCKRQAADGAQTCAAHADLKLVPAHSGGCGGCDALTAAGVRVDDDLDPSWFDDPQLDKPTPLTVTDDGRIYGHLATWGTCHIAYSGVCITPPRSRTNYANYRTGEVIAGGRSIPVGQITMDTDHAEPSLSAAATKAHYDHTGTAVADVAAGEDAHGIWIAGAVRPDVLNDAGKLHKLRAASPSGDWRRIGGALELVAALTVNVPGFPIPRSLAASGWMVEGVQTSLVAAGIVRGGQATSAEDMVRKVLREEQARERMLAEADAAVAASRDAMLARLDQTVGV